MNKPVSSPVENAGASGSPVSSSGKASAQAVAPVIVEVAKAPMPSRAAVTAEPVVAPRKASSPMVVNPEPSKPLEYSPGVAELSPAERRAAFMAAGSGTEDEAKEEQPEDIATDAPANEEQTPAEEQPVKVEEEAAPQGAADPDAELVSGLAKFAEKSPELRGLLKRTQAVLKQNSDRAKELATVKAEVEALRAKPAEVLPPTEESPLAHATTEAAVDAEVKALVTEARNRIRWLERNPDGGVWNEGKPNEQTLTAEDVAACLNHYEDLRDNAPKLAEARKAELAEYAASLKTLGVPPEELVKPAVPTRESKFAARVPEIRRDPAWLQFLADAQAGREAREEAARGVQVVKLDPAKAKPKTEPQGSKTSDNQPQRVAAPSPTQTTDLETLRAKAANGDESARQALRRAFVHKVT